MIRVLLSIAAMLLAGAAWAQGTQYLSTDGALFTFEKNQYGAVLTSVAPKDEPLIVMDEPVSPIDVGDVLYLGRSCDAFSQEFGDGSWNWTNGGFIVDFPGLRVAFPGQEIDVVPGNRCRI